MKIITRVLTGICLAAGLQAAQAAPVTWAANGHEYEIIRSEGVTWTAANATTNALGSGWHLATLTSASENAFVVSLIAAGLPGRSHFWLGGTDVSVEGAWAWVTGEAFSYSNWGAGEPNNSGNEDYLALDLTGATYTWNDAPDALGQLYGFARGYVIERTVSSNVPEPGTLSLLGLALLAIGVARRKGAKA